jgi:hypothetical protein
LVLFAIGEPVEVAVGDRFYPGRVVSIRLTPGGLDYGVEGAGFGCWSPSTTIRPVGETRKITGIRLSREGIAYEFRAQGFRLLRPAIGPQSGS